MPHIAIKVRPGRSEQQKQELADSVTREVMNTFGNSEDEVSVAFEEVEPDDWAQEVFHPEIRGKWQTLYKKPGYELD